MHKQKIIYVFNPYDYTKVLNEKRNSTYTGTLVDFMSKDEIKEVKRTKNYDLSDYDPTPKEIKEHFSMVNELFKKLIKINPNDVFLISLQAEENLNIKYFTNWYENYE